MSSLAFDRGLASNIHVGDLIAQLLINLLSAVNHVHKLSALVALIDLAGTHDLVFGVLNEFVPMGQPAGETGQREHNRKHLSGDTECLVDDARVEIDVGV